MAEASRQVIVNMNDKGVVTLRLNRKPVNAFNLELLTELNIILAKLESDESCKGIILTSALNGIFSAGWDLQELYKPDLSRLRQYRRSLHKFWMKLYGYRPVTIAAINGHSFGGACVFALACDYRIMAEGNFRIGLNEAKLGIDAPFWFQDTLINTVGVREADWALQLGHLYSPEEAKRARLVDELAPMDQVLTRAHVEMEKWIKIPEEARVLYKRMLRQPTIDRLRNQQEEEIDEYIKLNTQESFQKSLEMIMIFLKKRKQSKL